VTAPSEVLVQKPDLSLLQIRCWIFRDLFEIGSKFE
jgi:hypothetical protein